MSQTFRLVCHETKQKIWIGQGWGKMDTFYSDEPETMGKLGRFLLETMGKNLVVLDDNSDYDDCGEYKEFERDN